MGGYKQVPCRKARDYSSSFFLEGKGHGEGNRQTETSFSMVISMLSTNAHMAFAGLGCAFALTRHASTSFALRGKSSCVSEALGRRGRGIGLMPTCQYHHGITRWEQTMLKNKERACWGVTLRVYRGVSLVETAILIALIALTVTGAVRVLGSNTRNTLCSPVGALEAQQGIVQTRYRWSEQDKKCMPDTNDWWNFG
jgi:hypothetical protein